MAFVLEKPLLEVVKCSNAGGLRDVNDSVPNQYGYSTRLRLRKKEDFQRVFKNHKRLFGHNFVLYYCFNNLDYPRLGVIVSRKNIRKAVLRSRIKRLTREIFRIKQQELKSLDIIVIAQKQAVKVGKKELYECLTKLFEQLNRRSEESLSS